MKTHDRRHWPGMGLICAGTIVLIVGLIIVIFKELNIPRYWVPVAVGVGLIIAGGITHGARGICNGRAAASKDQ